MATAPPQPEPPKVWMFVSKVRQYFPSVFQNRNLSWPKQGQGTNDWGGDLTDRPALLAPLRGSAAWSPWQTMARPSLPPSVPSALGTSDRLSLGP